MEPTIFDWLPGGALLAILGGLFMVLVVGLFTLRDAFLSRMWRPFTRTRVYRQLKLLDDKLLSLILFERKGKGGP